MKRALLLPLALIASCAPAPAAYAQGADVLLNCSSCHTVGAAPEGRPPSPYPNLNGQPLRYLERQLQAYREGLRVHPQMQATATALGQGDAAMARLYGDAPAPALRAPPADRLPAEARILVEDGDWTRGLPPCASCHAMDPQDRARMSPRLHGHPAAYLERQLRAYAEGTRRSDPMGRMRAFAARLSAAEMSALAEYYAAWSARDTQEETDQ